VINVKSQGFIAKHLSWDWLLYYKSIAQFAGERLFKIGEHWAKLPAKWLIAPYSPYTFILKRCRTHQISKITCVLQTETVTNCCYVNRQINISLLSINVKLL